MARPLRPVAPDDHDDGRRLSSAPIAREPGGLVDQTVSSVAITSWPDAHGSGGDPVNVILAGGYRNGDIHAAAGDWVVGAPGTEETARADDEDCWCLSRIEPPGVRFTGWRRWVPPFWSR